MKNLLFILVFFGACQNQNVKYLEEIPNKFVDKQIQRIYDFQDKRQTDSLLAFFQNQNPIYRETAAAAFASVQDSNAIDPLLGLLKDPSHKVRRAAAYSLGQIGHPKAAKKMYQSLENQLDTVVWQNILEAIGKCADSVTVEQLAQQPYEYNSIVFGQISGLYRAMLKKVSSPTTTKTIFGAVDDPKLDDSVKVMASFYLARNPQKKYHEYEKRVIALSKYSNQILRANIATSLLGIAPENALPILQQMSKDSSALVRINTARALSNFENDTTLLSMLFDQDANVQVAASEALLKQAKKSKRSFVQIAEKLKEWRTRANVLQIAVRFDEKDALLKTKFWYEKSKNIYEKGFLLKAIAQNPKELDFIAQNFSDKNPQVLRTYCLEAILEILQNPSFDNKSEKTVLEILQKSISSKDEALIALAAGELANKEKKYAEKFDKLDFLQEAKKALPLPQAYETLIALQEAIDVLENKKSEKLAPPTFNNPIDWEYVKHIPLKEQALIKTEKGDILIEFFVEDAPATVANFLKLAESKFFNGKNFHRIVPNFVAQGGCPRGDGYGGAPYTIRSEFAPLRYTTGMLGMASAGKDTEGCQWFITHAPTPHLDGRYTIFAKVVKGMDVVQKIGIGDKILEVKIKL